MKADIITKEYVRNTEVFSDIFNYYVYNGQQVIHPEQLVERDTTNLSLPYGSGGALVLIQRFRDIQKLYTSMSDGKAEYVLFGVENQSDIHYAMAVRNNLYDALEYAEQVEAVARSHKAELKQKHNPNKKLESGEFLSGFWKEDRLIPSITVTIFFGADEWDGPMSLFDMMDISDPNVLACMDNYRIRLISPAQMSDSEIMKFQSSLREVMLFIKHSRDMNKLEAILTTNRERFSNLERRAADVIKVITHSDFEYAENEVKVNMCQAILDMKQKSKLEGKLEGRLEGKLEGKLEVARQLKQMGLSIDKIAQAVNYPIETVKEWIEQN